MKTRTLGSGGLTVSQIGFSCMGLVALPGAAEARTKGAASTRPGRRRLGTLEVSSIGLGVQNMTRTYQTTIPNRSEMITIVRAASDSGIALLSADGFIAIVGGVPIVVNGRVVGALGVSGATAAEVAALAAAPVAAK